MPGPSYPLYSAGAQLQHFYPVSALADGQGLNMTVQSYNGNLDFGVIACRELVPDLWVMMDLLTKKGESKVVERCAYPLTGVACVKRIYTDLCTLECTPQGLKLVDTVEGLTREELEKLINLPIAA